MGGKIPQSHYFNEVLDTTNKKELAIPKASKKILEFPLNNLGDLLKYIHSLYDPRVDLFKISFNHRWDFHSEEGDVAFAVYRKHGSKFVTIFPHDRVNCHLSPEKGEICCEETGVCKLPLITKRIFF